MHYLKRFKNWKNEKKALKIYGEYYNKKRKVLRQLLFYYTHKKGYKIAIWGGGLKGITFLKLVDRKGEFVKYIYDIDKSKINSKLSTGHIVVDYKDTKFQDVDIVFIMNNNFETEIAGMLKEENMNVILVNVDSIICGDLSTKEALIMYKGDGYFEY